MLTEKFQEGPRICMSHRNGLRPCFEKHWQYDQVTAAPSTACLLPTTMLYTKLEMVMNCFIPLNLWFIICTDCARISFKQGDSFLWYPEKCSQWIKQCANVIPLAKPARHDCCPICTQSSTRFPNEKLTRSARLLA